MAGNVKYQEYYFKLIIVIQENMIKIIPTQLLQVAWNLCHRQHDLLR